MEKLGLKNPGDAVVLAELIAHMLGVGAYLYEGD
jgi:hypothetical protein